jgi:SAM-dependent methyltransferase
VRQRFSNCTGYSILGVGYATPYLEVFREEAVRVLAFMPAEQGVMNWPSSGLSSSALVEITAMPLPNSCIDRALIVHALESTAHPHALLSEIWRILTPGGRVILVVPCRSGLWARLDRTPFGHGRPYSRGQLGELLRETLGLDNTLPADWINEMPGRVVTKYEGRAQRDGRACYYFAYRRNQQPAPDVPVIKEIEMTHVVFNTPLNLDDMLAHFEGSEHKLGDTIVRMLHGYRGRNVLLFEVYIHEPTLDQHISLVISPRETEHEYTLKVGTMGYPRSTPGLQKAVALMAEWVVSLSPEAKVVKHKLGDYAQPSLSEEN